MIPAKNSKKNYCYNPWIYDFCHYFHEKLYRKTQYLYYLWNEPFDLYIIVEFISIYFPGKFSFDFCGLKSTRPTSKCNKFKTNHRKHTAVIDSIPTHIYSGVVIPKGRGRQTGGKTLCLPLLQLIDKNKHMIEGKKLAQK